MIKISIVNYQYCCNSDKSTKQLILSSCFLWQWYFDNCQSLFFFKKTSWRKNVTRGKLKIQCAGHPFPRGGAPDHGRKLCGEAEGGAARSAGFCDNKLFPWIIIFALLNVPMPALSLSKGGRRQSDRRERTMKGWRKTARFFALVGARGTLSPSRHIYLKKSNQLYY